MRRRRLALGGIAALAVVTAGWGFSRLAGSGNSDEAVLGNSGAPGTRSASTTSTTPATDKPLATPSTAVSTTTTLPPRQPSDNGRLSLAKVVRGTITPKSVVASGTGVVFAQNMMYSHTVTAYDQNGDLTRTIPDSVDLAKFGIQGYPGSSYKGAPVEAAFTDDGAYAYVSNYSMYGPGFGPEGKDSCAVGDGTDNSFLYRVNVKSFEVDQVIQVGPVPKYVAITPDQRYVLVSNWCGDDVSIVDRSTAHEIGRVHVGRHPRGIAITKDSQTAYVAVMGSTTIARIDLPTRSISYFQGVGGGPRHLVLSPDDRWLYVTTNRDGHVSKLDAKTGTSVGKASTGTFPRSLAMAPDGRSLYVVNYGADSVSKVLTDRMEVVQTIPTGHHPIGVTYEPVAGRVWVANYSGTLMVFDDK